jgi:hypothetical protein
MHTKEPVRPVLDGRMDGHGTVLYNTCRPEGRDPSGPGPMWMVGCHWGAPAVRHSS